MDCIRARWYMPITPVSHRIIPQKRGESLRYVRSIHVLSFFFSQLI
jgi:hypothetical protein